MKDYYKILGISKDVREEDIKKAYHNLALRYHPDKNNEPGAEQYFIEILEAYRVLSDKNRRCEYDLERKTIFENKNNRKTTDSPWTNPYDFDNENDFNLDAFLSMIRIFSKLNRFEMYTSSRRQSKMSNSSPPVEHEIYVSLEELFTGVTRKVRIARLSYGGLRREEKLLNVHICPGCRSGTKITFPREGDRIPGKVPADVVFIVRQKPHVFFKRNGLDLKFTTYLPLHMALGGDFIVNVPTIEGRIIEYPIKGEIIRPDTIKMIPRRGLPDYNDPNKRGNLLIGFKIKYPQTMTLKTRKMVMKHLFS